jgi:hypothetical protein
MAGTIAVAVASQVPWPDHSRRDSVTTRANHFFSRTCFLIAWVGSGRRLDGNILPSAAAARPPAGPGAGQP